jgi:hypothetical protein
MWPDSTAWRDHLDDRSFGQVMPAPADDRAKPVGGQGGDRASLLLASVSQQFVNPNHPDQGCFVDLDRWAAKEWIKG